MPLRKVEEICVFNTNLYNPQKSNGHAPTRKAVGCTNGNAYHGEHKRTYLGGDTTRFPNNYLEFKCVDNYSRLHTSQKPIKLMEYLIKTYTNEGETILDFTMGSGSTGVACKNLKRNFIGIELEEKYFKIAKERIESHKVRTSLV
jgi:site-specific DNA-methyltransferase (adenine-specific)